jgi:hypothetical protein
MVVLGGAAVSYERGIPVPYTLNPSPQLFNEAATGGFGLRSVATLLIHDV